MLRKSILLIVWTLACISAGIAQGEKQLRILTPLDNAQVPIRPLVEGSITNPKSTDEVWVVVHPIETSDFWIQPKVTIREKGRWSVAIYIGRPGSIDVGKSFEIMAVANPKTSEQLKEGQVLRDWLPAEAKSEVIKLTRE